MPKVILCALEVGALQGESSTSNEALPMSSKENDVFYLKLQWISAKDENERKQLAEKIKQLLSNPAKG